MTTREATAEWEAPARGLRLSRDAKLGWLLMSPALLLLATMAIAPAIYLLHVSFRHENLLGPGSAYVGLQNYVRVLSDAGVWSNALSTVQFVVLSVAIELALGLGLALLLNRRLPETDLLTALFILPLGVAPVVTALVFRVLLDPAYPAPHRTAAADARRRLRQPARRYDVLERVPVRADADALGSEDCAGRN